MIAKYHPARRLLSDLSYQLELMDTEPGGNKWAAQQLKRLNAGLEIDIDSASREDAATLQFYFEEGRVFLITNTVLDKLGLLKAKKGKNGHLDWSVFKDVDIKPSTYILPDRRVLRVRRYPNMIRFALLEWLNVDEKRNHVDSILHLAFVDAETWDPCMHLIDGSGMHEKGEFIFKLFSFIYLSDIEEEIIKPGQSKGTRKSGKVINTFDHPITIINSKWNITAIRNEEFGVSGHFAIRWTGIGRTEPKVVWIDPFIKHGYIRKAKSESL